MSNMADAPKDGRRILIKHTVYLYQTPTSKILDNMGIHNAERRRYYRLIGANWYPVGSKWEEAWWDEEYLGCRTVEVDGTLVSDNFNGTWMPWCGEYACKTSPINHPLEWVHLPGEENGPSEQHRLDLENHKRGASRREVFLRVEHDASGNDDD